jgi:predicted GNAT superfamily acetyltransferase
MKDMPVVLARCDGRLVGFLVSSSQAATRNLALPQAKYRAYPASPEAYNSGPLCIAASARGHGLVAKLFQMQRSLLPEREGVAFIRRDNVASRAVHAKYGFREVAEFTHVAVEYLVVSYGGDKAQR